MVTENLRNYKKIEPSSFFINNNIVQIIVFSSLLLWIVVYTIKAINFNEYADGSLYDLGSLIKAILSLAALCFTVSILLGAWTYYKIKRSSSTDPSNGIVNSVKWLIFGIFVFMLSIPHILFPEADRLSGIYLVALTYAGKYVMGKISKNPE